MCHLLNSTSPVPSTVLSTLYTKSMGYCRCPHFAVEETKIQRLLPEIGCRMWLSLKFSCKVCSQSLCYVSSPIGWGGKSKVHTVLKSKYEIIMYFKAKY